MFDRRRYRFQKLFVTRLATQGAEVSVLDLWSLMSVAGGARDYRDNQRTGKKRKKNLPTSPKQKKLTHTTEMANAVRFSDLRWGTNR